MIPTYNTLTECLADHPGYVSVSVEFQVTPSTLFEVAGLAIASGEVGKVGIVVVDGEIIGIIDQRTPGSSTNGR